MGLVGAEDQGVAVGLGVCHGDAADHAGAAAAIVDRHRLAERIADRMRDQPRRDVDRAAGRVGHHDGDGAAGKLCARAPRTATRPVIAPQSRPPSQHGDMLSQKAGGRFTPELEPRGPLLKPRPQIVHDRERDGGGPHPKPVPSATNFAANVALVPSTVRSE